MEERERGKLGRGKGLTGSSPKGRMDKCSVRGPDRGRDSRDAIFAMAARVWQSRGVCM